MLREFEWEARHNYINSMMTQFFDLFPATLGRCHSKSMNASESKDFLAQIMLTHLRCSQQTVDALGIRQYEELGARRTNSLDNFGNQLELELRKLLQKRAPLLAQLLHNADEDFLLDISMLIGQKTGEESPSDCKLSGATAANSTTANTANAYANSPKSSKHRQMCPAMVAPLQLISENFQTLRHPGDL